MKRFLLSLCLIGALGIGSWMVTVLADEVQQRESEVHEIEEDIKK